MKTKVLNHSFIHKKETSTFDVKLINLDTLNEDHNESKKIFKFTYRTYNSVESFTGELFDGREFNPILSAIDLGIKTDNGTYLHSEERIKARISEFTAAGIEFIKLLF